MHTLSSATVGSSTARRSTAIPLRWAWLLLIALLALALVAGGAIVGSRLLPAAAVIPQGGAAVFAYNSNGDIFTVRADGTDVRQLTSGPDIESDPTWSPDGTRIAYRLWQDGGESIAVMDGAGANRTTVAATGKPRQDCGPGGVAWSPDSAALVFAGSDVCVGTSDLFIVPSDASSPATKLLAPGVGGQAPAWSPDGTRLAFEGRESTGGTGLLVVDVGTGGALAGGLVPHRISDAGDDPAQSWWDARWSPDGTEVAASAGTNADCVYYDTGTQDVFVVQADGSGQRPLAAETAKEYVPTWSPDGQRLAFQRLVDPSEWVNGRPCTTSTWLIDRDGSNERRLEGFGPDPVPPQWSPDGTLIAGGGPAFQPQELALYFVPVDGSPLVAVDVNNDLGTGTWQPFAVPFPMAPPVVAVSPAR